MDRSTAEHAASIPQPQRQALIFGGFDMQPKHCRGIADIYRQHGAQSVTPLCHSLRQMTVVRLGDRQARQLAHRFASLTAHDEVVVHLYSGAVFIFFPVAAAAPPGSHHRHRPPAATGASLRDRDQGRRTAVRQSLHGGGGHERARWHGADAPSPGETERAVRSAGHGAGRAARQPAQLASPKIKNIVGSEDGISARAMLAKLPHTHAELEALAAAIHNNPVYDGILISHDRKTAAVISEFKMNPKGFGAIERDVRAAIAPFADDTVELMVTGQPIFLSALERFSDRMGFLLPIALLVIGLLHFEAFRTVQGLVLPLVTGLVAIVWSLGLMTLLGLQLDPSAMSRRS
jgi:hypothetical protein